MQGMDRLLALQETDTAVDRLRVRRDALASGQTLATARAEADAAEQGLGELRLQLDELARDQRRFEQEIDSLTQKEVAENTRMYDGSIVNTKELEALQHELANLKKRRSDREDELLALMEQREEREALAVEAEVKAGELRSSLEATSDAADDELAGVEADLERRIAERADLATPFDPELLELYEELRGHKKGVGAVALIDGVCQGCHEKLSSMEVDKIKRTEGVRRCPYCRRILIV
jgi:predicted  nucleic acid-binding Zn-ribbon protein